MDHLNFLGDNNREGGGGGGEVDGGGRGREWNPGDASKREREGPINEQTSHTHRVTDDGFISRTNGSKGPQKRSLTMETKSSNRISEW